MTEQNKNTAETRPVKKTRGFVLSQLLIESIIVMGSIAVLLYAAGSFVAAGQKEEIKLRCAAANISAIEIIKQDFYGGAGIDDCIGYQVKNGEYLTAVVSVKEIPHGASEVYRLTVDTSHKSIYIEGTEMVSYISAH